MHEPYISMLQVAKRRLIPWISDRRAIKKLFDEGVIKFFTAGVGKRKTYFTTKKEIDKFIKKVTKNI